MPSDINTTTHLIKSSVHIHLDHDNCFEVIVLDGDGEEIKELAEAIMASGKSSQSYKNRG